LPFSHSCDLYPSFDARDLEEAGFLQPASTSRPLTFDILTNSSTPSAPGPLPGRTENDAATILEALLQLQRLANAGIAVLVLHHPKKGKSAAGQSARGSGALTGNVDIIIEMDWFARPHEDDRRRRLLAFSRHDATPRRRLIELARARHPRAPPRPRRHRAAQQTVPLLARRSGKKWEHDPWHMPDLPSLEQVFADMLRAQDGGKKRKKRRKKKAGAGALSSSSA
jgi:hypothetical protein